MRQAKIMIINFMCGILTKTSPPGGQSETVLLKHYKTDHLASTACVK